MSAVIFWQINETTFEYVIPDATTSENHRVSNQVTSHPVELGVEVADHIIAQPDEISIEGVLSNTPVEYMAALRNPPDRAEQIYEKLLDLREKGYLAYILTSLRQYENMALVSFTVPRDAERGGSIFVQLTFRQVKVAESAVVDAPEPTMERARPEKKLGRQSTEPASREISSKSLTLRLTLRGLKAFFGS